MTWRIPFLSKRRRCALCRQERAASDLLPFEGRLVCRDCLRLMREEGISFPSTEDPGDV